MAICPNCKQEKGCGCSFQRVDGNPIPVCTECAAKLRAKIKTSTNTVNTTIDETIKLPSQ